MYAAGLDAVQIYVPWNVHETSPGVYDFDGQQDLVGFIRMAQKTGLLVILRAGPYICGEWEFGGFPPWILKNNGSIVVRSMDPGYIKPVDKWLAVLLPKMRPLLYSNGGPVIMVQVENEYGSYSGVDCGLDYTAHLRDLFKSYLGDDIVLFTTDGDGDGYLKCGAINGTLATVDFGAGGNVTAALDVMRQWNKGGPLVNSEFYTGWLDYWQGSHSRVDTDTAVKSLKEMLDIGASVNMYMFEGGTNFGYMNGADPPFNVCPTSYDYDAPLTEAGDLTEKYNAIKTLLAKYKTLPNITVHSLPKKAYGNVTMLKYSTVLDSLESIAPSEPVHSPHPLSMEEIDQGYGFILYRHIIQDDNIVKELSVPGIRDRGYVMLDGEPQGMLDRTGATSMNILSRKGQSLDILVENQGRINFGAQINGNRKGIISDVTLGGNNLTEWDMYPINFTQLYPTIHQKHGESNAKPSLDLQPSIYVGIFMGGSDEIKDTYLNLCGWSKGQAFLNGFNLGRYWPTAGPQVTLYVPKGVIYADPQPNVLVLVELEAAPCPGDGCYVQLNDHYNVSGRCFYEGPKPTYKFRSNRL
ncbi:hypothetical protein CAPTEDRAFT_174701 [Capitella teleta]|uniref:Uncharacterized protein n=1 Tax=Capitella teleta TaxID=283909 RepID=R7V3L8_CAPTE|nr:hypothetical protein CAPTEDRAFT_174701 [Capitella teleta]|eukprot:ELU13067.1 hypothetical protein CAPTEDRAFT_174701 [Capitella teleta]